MSYPTSFTRTAGERANNQREANKRWRSRNVEKVRAHARKNGQLYRERHPERVKESRTKEYQKNRERYLERSKAWRLANPERYRESMRLAYQRSKARQKAERCLSCESILKEQGTVYCNWCVKTYQLQHAH